MLVSIIIPIFNVEQYIGNCLNSVVCQTAKASIECILVDDYGQDKSMEIAEKFINKYNGLIEFHIIHHESNRGLSAARNSGLDRASGEYVFFLDSDDEITPDCISLLTSPLMERQYDMVVGDIKAIGTKPQYPYLSLEDGEILGRENIYTTKKKGQWYQMAQNKLYRRAFLLENNLWFKEGIIHEDELWSSEIACLLTNMYVVKAETYLYNIREGSIMTDIKFKKRVDSFVGILNGFDDFITSHGLTKDAIANDLYFRQFVYAIHMVWKQGIESYNMMYPIFRDQFKRSKWHLILANGTKYRRTIRDLHYFVPSSVGRHLCRKILIERF